MGMNAFKRIAPWAAFGALIVAVGADKIAQHVQTETLDVTVTRLGAHSYVRTDAGFNFHDYPIETDKGIFNDCDSPTSFKFDGGDIWKQMRIGERWRITANGVGLWGSHRTLLSAERLQPK